MLIETLEKTVFEKVPLARTLLLAASLVVALNSTAQADVQALGMRLLGELQQTVLDEGRRESTVYAVFTVPNVPRDASLEEATDLYLESTKYQFPIGMELFIKERGWTGPYWSVIVKNCADPTCRDKRYALEFSKDTANRAKQFETSASRRKEYPLGTHVIDGVEHQAVAWVFFAKNGDALSFSFSINREATRFERFVQTIGGVPVPEIRGVFRSSGPFIALRALQE